MGTPCRWASHRPRGAPSPGPACPRRKEATASYEYRSKRASQRAQAPARMDASRLHYALLLNVKRTHESRIKTHQGLRLGHGRSSVLVSPNTKEMPRCRNLQQLTHLYLLLVKPQRAVQGGTSESALLSSGREERSSRSSSCSFRRSSAENASRSVCC